MSRGAPRLVAVEPPPTSEELVQLCAFRVGGEEYVLDIKRVREIIAPQRITAVPHAPPFVAGVIKLRGEIIPVSDLRERLGVPVTPPTRKSRHLITLIGSRKIALVVDEVTEVLRIPRAEIKPVPAMLAGSGRRLYLGVCGPKERLKLLLNVRALLDSSLQPPGVELRALAAGPRNDDAGGGEAR